MRSERATGGPLDYLALLPDAFTAEAGYPLVVFLHGYGSNMDDLANLAAVLHSTGYVHVVPNAPHRAFVGFEADSRAWFERGGAETPDAVAATRALLRDCLAEVRTRFGTPPGRTVLVGFSQGGNLALRHGLAAPEEFAGVAVLAGSLRQLDALTSELPATRQQRLFVAHGYRDTVVPFQWGRNLVDYLTRHGYRPEFRAYTIGHTITTPLVDDLRRWLLGTLEPIPEPS